MLRPSEETTELTINRSLQHQASNRSSNRLTLGSSQEVDRENDRAIGRTNKPLMDHFCSALDGMTYTMTIDHLLLPQNTLCAHTTCSITHRTCITAMVHAFGYLNMCSAIAHFLWPHKIWCDRSICFVAHETCTMAMVHVSVQYNMY